MPGEENIPEVYVTMGIIMNLFLLKTGFQYGLEKIGVGIFCKM